MHCFLGIALLILVILIMIPVIPKCLIIKEAGIHEQ